MHIPPFLGVVGVKKWSPFLDFGAQSPIFGHLKMGTFAENTHFRVPKKRTSSGQIEKRRPLFHANYPKKWWNGHLFYAFTTFG